jgi:hypothetical protein
MGVPQCAVPWSLAGEQGAVVFCETPGIKILKGLGGRYITKNEAMSILLYFGQTLELIGVLSLIELYRLDTLLFCFTVDLRYFLSLLPIN